jgi:putative membrane protein
MIMKSVTAAALIIGMTASAAMAQMSPGDKTFATKAASGGLAEVTLGQLATQNAANPKVRAFGERMVTDHTQANQELQLIAQSQNMPLPSTPDAASTATEQKIRNLKGEAFDSAYMRDMVQDHRQDVADFRREAENGQNPDLKAFAQKHLPTLEQHLQMAEAARTK